MNGALSICNRQSLAIEVKENIKEKNMFLFGSTRQKLQAYQIFLKNRKEDKQLGNRPHITPSIMQVYQFMRKYQEKLPGFTYILDEILENQIFNAQNLKLTAMVTLDFENYIEMVQKA